MSKKRKSEILPQPVSAIVQEPLAQLGNGTSDISYQELLASLKERIRAAQVRAALAVNRELVLLYWQIGRDILERQQRQGWGAKVIDRLATDLRRAFPDMQGLSPTNLKYMRRFAETYPDMLIGQQLVDQLPWGHNIVLMGRVESPAERFWYAGQAIENGWSRNVLVHQIESGLHLRQGQAVTNFDRTLPPPQSDLARELLKDPYNFDFLSMTREAQERELHRRLLEHLREFLLELGVGFAFVGSQYRMEVSNREYFLDLLFYHLRLRCFVVIELKTGEFEPEFAGKMNFYLAASDDLLRHPDDQPSIGIILCKSKDKLIVEYALRDTRKPIGVAAYRLATALPKRLAGSLPTVEQLEKELTTLDSGEGKRQ